MIEPYDGVAPFRVVEAWEQLPEGFRHLDVTDVAVDAEDRVYVLTRFEAQVFVYDRVGQLISVWGSELFSERPHGITVAPDGTVYVVDEFDNRIRHLTREGLQLDVIGTGEPSDTGYVHETPELVARMRTVKRGAGPFNHPTKVVVAPSGDLYATDGYGNSRVHRFAPDGALLQSWGEPGEAAGQFRVPHSIVATDDGRLIVADRENDRIQLFDLDGRFLAQWTDVQRPTAIALDRSGNLMIAELAWLAGETSLRFGAIHTPRPARLSLLDPHGTVLGRWTEWGDGSGPGGLLSPHGLALDSTGAVYVGEVSHSFAASRTVVAGELNTLQKFVPVEVEQGSLR